MDSVIRRQVDAVFEAHGVRRQMKVDAYVSAAACSFVASGLGVAVVEPFTAWDFARQGLIVARPFRPEVVFEFRMLRPANRPPSLLVDAFAGHVERALAEHIRQTGAETAGDPAHADSRPAGRGLARTGAG